MSLTYLVVERASTVVYNLQLGFCSKKLISALLKVRKDIPNSISMLILDIRKISSKNHSLLALLLIEKVDITISKISILKPSLF